MMRESDVKQTSLQTRHRASLFVSVNWQPLAWDSRSVRMSNSILCFDTHCCPQQKEGGKTAVKAFVNTKFTVHLCFSSYWMHKQTLQRGTWTHTHAYTWEGRVIYKSFSDIHCVSKYFDNFICLMSFLEKVDPVQVWIKDNIMMLLLYV